MPILQIALANSRLMCVRQELRVYFAGLAICSASILTAVRSVDNTRLGGGFHGVADATGMTVVVM